MSWPALFLIFQKEKKMKIDKKKIQKIQRKILELEWEINSILDKHLGVDEGQWHVVGEWDCLESPVGLCVYHFIKDPSKDMCIFCNFPHERK